MVLQHLNKKATPNESIESTMTKLLTRHTFVFAYKDLEVAGPSKAFMSSLILSLLGSTHLQDTLRWVEISELDLDVKYDYRIKRVLAFCTITVRY